VIEVDRTQIHDLSQEALHAYASSDARLARVLAERRWASARRNIDRTPVDLASPVDHTRRVVLMAEAARVAAEERRADTTVHAAGVDTTPRFQIAERRRPEAPVGDPLADAG
jgi:hypothetical protein